MELTNLKTQEISNKTQTVDEKTQNKFLQSTLGKVIDKGVDIGLRALLPNFIEDQVIDIKNSVLQSGLASGIKQTISSAIELGKSAIGIVTGKFDNINQARNAIKNGGIIDGISSVLDFAVNKTVKNGKLTSDVGKIIKRGKNAILNAVDSNIDREFNEQINSIEKIGKYTNNWKECYKKQDYNGMEREYNKIKEKMNTVIPMESTINDAKRIENIQTLIKNKGKNFNLSNEEIELAKKLVS